MYRNILRHLRPATLLTVIVFFTGCSIYSLPKLSVKVQHPADVVTTGERVPLYAEHAVDRSIPVKVLWDAQGGTLSSVEGTSVTWTAPAQGGSYNITATAQAGVATDSDTVTIIVIADPGNGDPGNGDPSSGVISLPIAKRGDHGWYENSRGGENMSLPGRNIWFGGSRQDYDSDALFRWTNVRIPHGATIAEAYITFWHQPVGTDEPGINNKAVLLHIKGFKLPDMRAFMRDDFVSDQVRWPRTDSYTEWHITDVWSDEESEMQQTPDISAVIGEIVNQPGWHSGNALGIIFESQPLRDRYNRSMCVKESIVEECKVRDTSPVLVVHYE